ncbi:CaiB/BaiF CoA transferase family protein [Oceanibacterium hippocampi]|uniref:Succinyl-CoA:(R)-benzylsuccinate CoA-transferase subunit BbsF n=1 Tax=Oceanibacterium hippocampi TaxID=745714 RepID=A0A1Y5RZP1_9PROT|nr:CaiB/BaiF CoA-transferase family protein [Oceanibacterium hippocampi]SLN28652.1 Succinyl-CoA:(R)-benzylsuccinate CoA-transferase subunit BbsF [Oceanibacterium hippocampi]
MTSQGALAGFKVIDLSRVLGGPYCSQMLADHGADVIKIEPPQGDETRQWGPPFSDSGLSAYFSGVNRNKRSLALDIGTERGRDILLKLLEDADILLENFKAGSMERWGLGYETVLKERFPKLIHCSVTGFGTDGPFGGLPGYDAVVQAWTGLISVNGSEESGPVRLGIPLVDLGTGMNAAIGILLAVTERARSGKGQHIDISLFDTGIALQHPHAPNYFMSGRAPRLTGNAHPNISPYDLYRTKGRPVFLGIGNDRQFQRLCAVLGKPELANDPRFLSNSDRVGNRDALTAEIETLMAGHDGEEIAAALLAAGVPAGAALSVPDMAEHPHTLHREMVVEKDGYRGTGIPVKLGRTPGSVRLTPPEFGASNRDVLKEAGYSESEIDALIADGIVVAKPRKL